MTVVIQWIGALGSNDPGVVALAVAVPLLALVALAMIARITG